MLVTNAVAEELLRDLRREEELLAKAEADFRDATAKYGVASTRYIAVRNGIRAHLGQNPYHPSVVETLWPVYEDPNAEGDPLSPWEHPDFGRYQYLARPVGEAIIDVLASVKTSLSLQKIFDALHRGGLKMELRAVNAALLNTN